MDFSPHSSFNPLQNLKNFLTSRPPLLVFLICLVTFATTAVSFAYFVRRSDLKNPDIALDWNGLLENFAKLDFCVSHNGSSHMKPWAAVDREFTVNSQELIPPVDATATTDGQVDVTDDSGSSAGSEFGANSATNYSVSVLVMLKFGSEIEALPPNVSVVTGFMCGRFLGLTGPLADRDIRVTFDLPAERHLENCDWQKDCPTAQPVCITFHGLPRLPATTRKMKTCQSPVEPSGASSPVNLTSFSVARCPKSDRWLLNFDSTESLYMSKCHGVSVHVTYRSNPDWSVMLTEHDRALINLHLMYTSYFLLVMVMTLLCYAIVRGRPKTKMFVPEKVLLDS